MNGIPVFETMEKCCDSSFKNQQSGKCVGNADSTPVAITSSGSGGTGGSSGTPGMVEFECASGPTPLEYHPTRAFQVEKDQCVPAIDTAAFSYNMWVGDNFTGNTIYFLDQKNGIIYSYDTSSADAPTKVFDMSNASQVPVGLDLNWSYGGTSLCKFMVIFGDMTNSIRIPQTFVIFRYEFLRRCDDFQSESHESRTNCRFSHRRV